MEVKVMLCYAREDEELLERLKAHLSTLKDRVDIWHDRNISAGADWQSEISSHLEEAQIILLLISPDFFNSEYCRGIEMAQALKLHKLEKARVIPVILRPVLWETTPLGNLQVLPKDGKPVTTWPNIDDAFYYIAKILYFLVKRDFRNTTQKSLQEWEWEAILKKTGFSKERYDYMNLRLDDDDWLRTHLHFLADEGYEEYY
jgi:TIR domain